MLSDLIFRLRSLFRRSAIDNELDDELRFHLEQQVEKHVRSGLTRENAMRQTRLDFGVLGHVKEDCRESRGITFLETTLRDIRYALRQLTEVRHDIDSSGDFAVLAGDKFFVFKCGI
jgi:hypothetical protein